MERKEAIEVIKKNWPDNNFTMLCEALETLIPELRESEDEKIRNQIINFIEEYGNPIHCEWQKDWIAWLEKQGEHVEINPTEFDTRLQRYDSVEWNKIRCFIFGSAHGRLYLRDIDRKSITPKSPVNNKEVKYIHRNHKLLIQAIKL